MDAIDSTKLTPRNIEKTILSHATPLERFAVRITQRVGTMGFFAFILAWTLVWMLWNTFAPDSMRFDPFPSFVLWLFISNMIQILLLPLIMVGQNLLGKFSEARAQADFEVDTRSEKQIEKIFKILEEQQIDIREIKSKLSK